MLGFSISRENTYRIMPVYMMDAMSRNASAKPASHPVTTPDQNEMSR
jgi:hypothetical protein